MISRLARWALGGCLAVVALVAIADGVLRFTRLEEALKPVIGEALRQSGLHFAVAGPINAALLPSPRIEAAKITLSNDRNQLLVEAERTTIKLAVLPLLRAAIVVDEMLIERPRVAVSVDADGRSNFDLAKSSGGRPVPGGKVILKGGSASVDHARMGTFQLELQEVTAELGEGHDWLRASGKGLFAGKAVAFGAEIQPKANGAHRATLSLDTHWGNLAFAGDLSELTLQARATGKLGGKLLNPAELFSVAELPSILRHPVAIDMTVDATLSGGEVPRFVLTGSRTEITGALRVSSAPRFRVDGDVRIADLVLEEFMRPTVDWFGLAELIYDAISLIVDGVPGRGIANLVVDIERAQYNGQTIQGIGIDINVDDHVGTLRKLVARLPGDTELEVGATLRGPRGQREASGRLTLSGDRLAHTLRWLAPPTAEIRPAPPSQRPALFKIALDLARRPDGRHQADTSLLLDGIEGRVTTAIRFGRLLELDSTIAIGLVDPLPYLPLSGPDIPQSLRLTGLSFGSDVTIDTADPKAAILVRRAVIDLAGVDAVYDAPLLDLAAPPAAPSVAVLPTQLIGAWLGDLPRRVTEYMRPGPERSAVAKMMPEIEAALRMMDGRLRRLDFTSPLEIAVGRLAARDPRHEMVLTGFRATVGAAKPADARTTINVLKPRFVLGESRIDDLRIDQATLDFEASLERSGGTTRLTAVKVNELALDGDLDDRLRPEALPGIVGPTNSMRRLAVSLRASGEGRGGAFTARIAHLAAGDLASFDDIDVEVEERKDGVLSVVVATAAGKGVGVTRMPLRCTVTPRGAPAAPILDFRINLAGSDAPRHGGYDTLEPGRRSPTARRAPLLGAVQGEGFVTARAVVVRELQLRLGEASTLATRIAVTAPDRASGEAGLARLEGCLDATLQSQPRLSSLGYLPQELLLPILTPLWPGGAEAIRIGAEGGLHLTSEAIAGHVPLRVGIERRAGNRPAGTDLIELELDALRLQLQPRRSTIQVSFDGIRLRDGRDELKFTAPAGARLVALEQASESRRGCAGGANLRADLRLGTVDKINVPMVQRLLDRIGQVTRGERLPGTGAGQPCDPLALTLKAAEIGALPDLVRALTDAPPMRIAADRAPRLRDADLTLAVRKDGSLSFELSGGLTAARAGIFRSCSTVHPKTRRARDFSAEGTARFDARNKSWSAGFKGTFTCLDLVEAQSIAQAATGLNLKAAGAAVRQGDIETLSFEITVPPVASLDDLTRASGSIDFVGDLALDIDSALYRAGAGLLGLQDVMKRGVLVGGRIELRNGEVSGVLASKDPVLGNPRHDDYAKAERWPDVAALDFRGSLGKTVSADLTVRSADWVYVKSPPKPVCFDKARRKPGYDVPTWIQLVTICAPLAKGARCGPLEWRQKEEREYACR